jgi:hypothetical protein
MAGEIDQQELIKKFLSDLAERGAPSEDDPLPFVGAANKVWYKEIEGQILGVCKTYLTKCNCPDHLLYHITGEVLSRHRKNLPVELQKGEIPADEGKNSPAEPYNCKFLSMLVFLEGGGGLASIPSTFQLRMKSCARIQ